MFLLDNVLIKGPSTFTLVIDRNQAGFSTLNTSGSDPASHTVTQGRESIDVFLDRNKNITALTDPIVFAETCRNQHPSLYVISCSDSRVTESIMGARIGEVFSQRNIANRYDDSDPSSVAGLEYAVKDLQIPNVVVLGHDDCGGVTVALEESLEEYGKDKKYIAPYHPNRLGLDRWIAPIKKLAFQQLPALISNTSVSRNSSGTKKVPAFDKQAAMKKIVELNVIAQLNLIVKSRVVQDAWRSGSSLQVHGWVYSMQNGHIRVLETRTSTNLKKHN
ncbi:carbonic anhydrase [Phakopsora pachyrhizi]|nr:carbonic anhydrase [Phakopsora pachyrhizi]